MQFLISKENKHKTGIYCITNKINNKIYIGSTSTGFYLRYHQHKSNYNIGKKEIRILYRAFDKYGINNFKFEIVEICKKENCIKREQFYIDKGTDYNCCMIAGSLLGLKHSITAKTRTVIKGNHHCAVAVDMYSKKGKFIKSFNSLIEVQEEIGIKSKSNITQCCKGKVFSAGGYRWTLKNETLNDRPNRLGKYKLKIIKGDIEIIGTYAELVDYFIKIGYNLVKVSTITNALNRNINIYNYKIKKL